jgi:membrane protease subunit HflK
VSGRAAQVLAAIRRPEAGAALVLMLLFAYGATGFYTVPTTSLAVTRIFGAIIDPAVPPGVHWWWPPPLGRVDRVEVTRTFLMPVGYFLQEKVQGIPSPAAESAWLTGDTNILQLRARVNYRIADAAKYLFDAEAPQEMLRWVAGSALTEAASALPVDDLLTSGRLALIERVRARAQELLDVWGVGIQILTVNLESVDPPASVVAAFQDVQNARADRERQMSEAETYANGILPVARGEAEGKVNEALTFANQRLDRAHADATRFAQLAIEHRRAPGLLERRLYLETAERVLPRVRRYVLDPGGDGALPVRIVE